jgi:hypothetical protein
LLALSGAIKPSLVIDRMKDILRSLDAKEIEQSILVVDPDRICRRRLPIE